MRGVILAAVVGGRPNLMKMAPILRAIDQFNRSHGRRFETRLIHAGLPNDPRLTDTSWGDVQMPLPDINLGVAAARPNEQTARIMLAIDRVLGHEHFDGVIVVGNSDAALASAIVAARARLPVFHVEAGLRSSAETPEDVNRRLCDSLSTLLFTPSEDADANLQREGYDPHQIVRVGNVMIDNLIYHLARSHNSNVLDRLGLIADRVIAGHPTMPPSPPKYGVLTLSRPENIEDSHALGNILQTLSGVSRLAPIVFVANAATRKRIEQLELEDFVADLTARIESFGGTSPSLPPGLYTVPPLAYLDFLRLLSQATVVFTDSGGIQEETTAMAIPCLTLLEETERPITVQEGTNRLVGKNRDLLRREALAALSGHGKQGRVPELWDGHAAERLVESLAQYYLGAQRVHSR